MNRASGTCEVITKDPTVIIIGVPGSRVERVGVNEDLKKYGWELPEFDERHQSRDRKNLEAE